MVCLRNKISYNIILPYKNKITIDYEISYFGFNFDRNRQGDLNCVSPLRDFEVKIDRFQIKQNLLNLKWTLHFYFDKKNYQYQWFVGINYLNTHKTICK